jgi:hypothetical protein
MTCSLHPRQNRLVVLARYNIAVVSHLKSIAVTEKHQKYAEMTQRTLPDALASQKKKKKNTKQHQLQIKASNLSVVVFLDEMRETRNHRASTTFRVHRDDAHETLTTTLVVPRTRKL